MYKLKDGRVVLTPAELQLVAHVFEDATVVVDQLEAAQNVQQGYPEVRLLRRLQECHEVGISTESLLALTTEPGRG